MAEFPVTREVVAAVVAVLRIVAPDTLKGWTADLVTTFRRSPWYAGNAPLRFIESGVTHDSGTTIRDCSAIVIGITALTAAIPTNRSIRLFLAALLKCAHACTIYTGLIV